jgi:2-oxoisovalerate dehydrogenase E1 component
MAVETAPKANEILTEETLIKAFELMCCAKSMSVLYEENKEVTAKYVHATSRGHEAIQLAIGLQLKAQDYLSCYYRDDSILLGIGITPYELMLQLLAKRDDIFSGGRLYYSHPSLNRDNMPKIPMQSSATGMQAIPATGLAMGIQYKEKQGLNDKNLKDAPVVVCSFGDASITEGEVAEAFQMAVLKQLPILYLVQDNEWDISAHASEIKAQDASEYAKGFKGLEVRTIDGTDFMRSYKTVNEMLHIIRTERRPMLLHAKVPLLNHHTSGVRKEWYRHDLEEAAKRDPFPRLRNQLIVEGIDIHQLKSIEEQAEIKVKADYQKALLAEDPKPEDLFKHDFAPTSVTEEKEKEVQLARTKR